MLNPAAIGAVGVDAGLVAALTSTVAIGASAVAVRARRAVRRTTAELERLAAHDALQLAAPVRLTLWILSSISLQKIAASAWAPAQGCPW